MFVGAVLCIIITLACSWLSWKRIKFCQVLANIPGPAAMPLVGNTLQFKRDSCEFFLQVRGWTEDYMNQGAFCVWLGIRPVVVIYKPEYVEALLSCPKNITKSHVYDHLHPWLGTGLLTSSGVKWKSRRRLLTSTFHFKILNNFISVYEKQSATLVTRLKENAGKGLFNIAPYISLCALDVICETAMGVDVNTQCNSESQYVKAVLSMCQLVQERQKSPWLWPHPVYKFTSSGKRHDNALSILRSFTNKVIDDRINERKQLNKTNSSSQLPVSFKAKRRILAFLDLLLEEYDKGNISREGVREEVDTFMFEGHDTTAASLQWTLHLLGKHPGVLAKLQKEVDDFYESLNGEMCADDLKQLRYTECVLKEALRLFPSVPLLGRQLIEDCEFGPYKVPKGGSVVVAVWSLHRHPDVWDDPDAFDPDRFLSENSVGRNPFAYVPFSAGPRNCIGQKFALLEEKVILSSVVRHFNIHSTQTTEDIQKSAEIILRSLEGISVELELRRG